MKIKPSKTKDKQIEWKLTKPSKKIYSAVQAICKSATLLGCTDITDLGEAYVQLFNQWVLSYGLRAAVHHAKALYNEATRYSSGLDVVPLTSVWVKRNKVDKLPEVLRSFRSSLTGTILERRITLSLLKVYNCLELPVVPNLDSILNPSTGRIGFASIQKSWEMFLIQSTFVKRIKIKFRKRLSQKSKGEPTRLFFSTKKGPKGPTATTAALQSRAIVGELKENLVNFRKIFTDENWNEVIEVNQQFANVRKDISNNDDSLYLRENIGKIVFIPDGIKTRTIAIGNYWIQDALLWLHKAVFETLREVTTDGTFNQNSQFSRVLKASSELGVWSFDLTAATDRFPLEPQVSVVKSLHPEMGKLWEKIIKNLSFEFKGESYQYAVGQPMGLYSSWAIFALTHHLVIQYCAWIENIKCFNEYAVLGDDVAIWEPRVAKRYKRILNLFDVKISEQKSFIPQKSNEPCIAEFAQRFADKGQEFTPLSAKQSIEAWESYWSFPGYLDWLSSHGFEIGQVPVSRIVSLLGLTAYQTNNLLCSVRIWELVRGPFGLTYNLPEEIEPYFNKVNLIKVRINLLLNQATEIDAYVGPARAKLEKLLAGSVPDNHYFLLILQTRLKDLVELVIRLLNILPGYESFDSSAVFASTKSFSLGALSAEAQEDSLGLPQLSELEYVPFSSFEKILASLTPEADKRILKGKYIQQLVKSALAAHKTKGLLSMTDMSEFTEEIVNNRIINSFRRKS